MPRRFGTRGQAVVAENEEVTGAEPHPTEGVPEYGIPPYPDPLPGMHHYPEPEPVKPEVLDVGVTQPYYSHGMAHGVQSPVHYGGRPAPPHHVRDMHRTEDEAFPEHGRYRGDPIPVYITEPGAAKSITKTALRNATVVQGADPIPLVTRNPDRTEVRLLNETASAPVRLMEGPYGQTGKVVGAILPGAMTSYLKLETQDEIWAVSDSSASASAVISVIDEYKIAR